jgi:hypothetical protein
VYDWSGYLGKGAVLYIVRLGLARLCLSIRLLNIVLDLVLGFDLVSGLRVPLTRIPFNLKQLRVYPFHP